LVPFAKVIAKIKVVRSDGMERSVWVFHLPHLFHHVLVRADVIRRMVLHTGILVIPRMVS